MMKDLHDDATIDLVAMLDQKPSSSDTSHSDRAEMALDRIAVLKHRPCPAKAEYPAGERS
ncbi:hypothetical protein ABRY95_04735 [Castellaniella ginsengisoli]|uniref:Uncharacterized protein n=1 Tax=Castellaniella ginsengisoli TaxID=546114 RepID=A0AB39G7I8_9BURK